MKVRRYEVDICEACYELKGQECHTPGCIFFLHGMDEVAEFLNLALIRPKVDGEIFRLQEDAAIISVEPD